MIPPSIFGRAWWRTIYNAVVGFDDRCDQDPAALEKWLLLTAQVLPCKTCRRNFTRVLRKYPPGKYVRGGRARRKEWFWAVRNEVRKHEGKRAERYKWTQGRNYGVYRHTKSGRRIYLAGTL